MYRIFDDNMFLGKQDKRGKMGVEIRASLKKVNEESTL